MSPTRRYGIPGGGGRGATPRAVSSLPERMSSSERCLANIVCIPQEEGWKTRQSEGGGSHKKYLAASGLAELGSGRELVPPALLDVAEPHFLVTQADPAPDSRPGTRRMRPNPAPSFRATPLFPGCSGVMSPPG